MLVICSILITINAGGINFLIKNDTQGKVISSSSNKYLVDFSSGLQKAKLAGKPSDYNRVLVDKSECVRIK